MPTARTSELQNTIDEQAETLEQVSDLVSEALDPELSREEVISKVKEIQDAVEAEEDTESDEDED